MAQELGKSFPVSPYPEVLAGASAVSFVSILITFYAWFPKDECYLLGVLALLPVCLPYAFIPLRLYGRRLRSGVTLAMTMVYVLVVPGIYLVRFAITWYNRWWVLGNLIVALLMQLVLCIGGVKAYMGLPRFPRTDMKGLAGPAYGFFLIALFLWGYSPVP